LLTTLKGLPLSYNRDLQEDKPALFDALDTVADSVEIMTELVRRLTVNRERLASALEDGGMLATEVADYLVTRGVPFREAHTVTGRIVRWALDEGRELQELSLEELRRFSSKFEPSVLQRLTVLGAINRKAQTGGTAQRLVERRIREWTKALA
jgi:argininosuccinate lyase